ncbi:lysozyme inhibitor LprI family protein [Roseburia hominis]|uniref:lysozyme inhibitor LprI family protein n=1 Tax=Roseburia hominis TaxID=301301 RepID=UPI0026726167|nr:lysozyme inhibitor LprI family protein [Roseburia hominis]
MKKSGAAVLIMLLLLTGCGDALDEKYIERRQTEKISQTEEQEQMPTGNTEVQPENSVEKYSAETEQQRYALNLPEAYRSKIDEIDDYIHRRMEEGWMWEDDESFTQEEYSALDEPLIGKKSAECALFHLGYALHDIDGNGVDELIFAYDAGYGESNISLLYTMQNEKAVWLIGGWSRCRVTLGEDGFIYNMGSSGAADNIYAVYAIGEDESSLKVRDYYFSGGWDDENWYHNTTGNEDKAESEILGGENVWEQFYEEFDEKTNINLELEYLIDYENEGNEAEIFNAVEDMSRKLEEELENNELTEYDTEQIQIEIYQLWDDELNHLWEYLKETVDEQTMQKLLLEQREWIEKKEQTIQTLQNNDGESLTYPYQAEITRKRVYELTEYIQE